MPAPSFELTYASIPFVLDQAQVVRLTPPGAEEPRQDSKFLPNARKQQPEANLIDELNRILPFSWMVDFSPPKRRLGRNLNALANQISPDEFPNYTIKIGEFFYPYSASRWSVFRGLATSSMVKEMVRLTVGGAAPATFRMRANPISPKGSSQNQLDATYTISTSMYMLPPRPLAELGGKYDGLYLVTLVDERYKWQYKPVSLTVDQNTSWSSLITSIAAGLGVSVSAGSIAAAYQQPEIDSQFWCNRENAGLLLDAAAANIGKIFVRAYAGTYALMTNAESFTQVNTNRGLARRIVRTAGGDIFSSGNLGLPVGQLATNTQQWPNSVKNAVIPSSIDVSFPKYVMGPDPVPHMGNSRYKNQRPSCWYEDSYGDTHVVNVPLTSGPLLTSGLSGVGTHCLHTTAKALYSGEVQMTGNPMNVSGLTAMAMQLAGDYWDQQGDAALDEAYPGTYAWTPEGFNDLLYTYSANLRQATCRVMRAEWNQIVREFQHSTPTISGLANVPYTNTPIGVGGPSVAQSWRDSFSGTVSTTTTTQILSGDYTINFAGIDQFPVQNRWRGVINSGASDEERVIFEGTAASKAVAVAPMMRGCDGSYQQAHANGSTINWRTPDHSYGVNLATSEKMMWVMPGAQQSGGISEAVLIPQTQSVLCLSQSGTFGRGGGAINTLDHWSGQVLRYDTALTSGSQFPALESVWLIERNGQLLQSGQRYDGQLVALASLSGQVSPVYAVNVGISSGMTINVSTLNVSTINVSTTINLSGSPIGRNIGVKVENSSSQTINAGGTPTASSYDTEEYDPDNMHAGGNPTRLTANSAGVYEAIGAGELSLGGTVPTAGSYATSQFYVNGAANDGKCNESFVPEDPPGTGSTVYNASFLLTMEFNLAATDYVEVFYTNNDASASASLTNQVFILRKTDRAG